MKFTLIFFILCSLSVVSQNLVTHYNIADGLPHDISYGLLQDSNGYMWIGTDNGLAKFNGRQFTNFTTDDGLRTNYVIDLDEDSEGRIVLATWGGGLQFLENDRILSPKISNDSIDKINAISLYSDHIIAPHVSGNRYYVKNDALEYTKNVLISDLNEHKLIENPNFSRSEGYLSVLDSLLILSNYAPTSPGKTSFKGVFKVDNEHRLHPIFPFLKQRNIRSINTLNDDTFIASQQDSIFVFDTKKVLKTYQLQITNPYIIKIVKTSSKDFLVITSDDQGFKNAHLYTQEFMHKSDLKKRLGIRSSISDVLEDHEGNLWVSTHGDGVFCIESQNASYVDFNNDVLPDPLVNGIAELNDAIYVLTPRHITKLQSKNVEHIPLKGFGKHIIKEGDAIKVSSLNQENLNNYPDLKNELAYRYFKLDSFGSLSYTDSLRIPTYNLNLSVDKKTIYDVVHYNDTLWIGTNLGSFYIDELSRAMRKKDIGSHTLLGNQITKFIKTKGILWIATTKGLHKLQGDNIQYFTTDNGLINNHINTMHLDHRGHIWVGTQRGISIYNGKAFFNIGEERQLQSPFIGAIFEDSNHTMWLGGDKGISKINNTTEQKLSNPPLLNIKQNHTNFTYDVVSYNRSGELLTEFRLNDESWSPLALPDATLNFDNYQKGTYTLQFRARKQDSTWRYSKPYNFSISIIWYKDWYFLTLITVLALLLVITIIARQLRRTKKRNISLNNAINTQLQLKKELSRVRENIAQDFHDDLGNTLARISMLSALVEKDKDIKNSAVRNKVKQITEDSNSLYKGTRDFIFSLKEDSDCLFELIDYLSDFGEDFFGKTSIKFELKKSVSENKILPYYWSKQLVFIFKEAMTNAFKHSECNHVLLNFTLKNNILCIECSDNGIGMVTSEINSSNGLFHMKKRAEKINGILDINSILGEGTTIYFEGETT